MSARLLNYLISGKYIIGAILISLISPLSYADTPTQDVHVQVDHQDTVFHVTAHMEVPVPQSIAWLVLTDFTHFSTFLHNVKHVNVVSQQGNRYRIHEVGEAEWGIISMEYQNIRDITLEPQYRITSNTISGTVKSMHTEMRLTNSNTDNVILDYQASIEPDSWLADIFGSDFIDSEVKEQFQSMAREMIKRYHGAPTQP
ncbi:SRPBCC family protein [Ferrovum sp. PN-J185]|uniref:SRPBCC family protein n=1 Tax=Ferrovum sp. PN-J185 TaxID=1356306 RepID=UPI000797433E|nr:SRPBCC family protein [Ferrovum sp. PN-J185]KXW56107.1 polyketide cyclase / dehydrase and lipid transport [Ferrovum sp. PN-J185]